MADTKGCLDQPKSRPSAAYRAHITAANGAEERQARIGQFDPAVIRRKSWTPRLSSSALIWRLTAPCVKCSSSAANVMLSLRPVALKARRVSRGGRWSGIEFLCVIVAHVFCENKWFADRVEQPLDLTQAHVIANRTKPQ